MPAPRVRSGGGLARALAGSRLWVCGRCALSHDEVRAGGTDAGCTPGLFSVSSVLSVPLSSRPPGPQGSCYCC